MKRIMIAVISLMLLAGCGEHQKETVSPDAAEVPEELVELKGLTMELEHAIYAPNSDTLMYLVRNQTAGPVCLGAEYGFQKWTGNEWEELPLQEAVSFPSIAYTVLPNESCAFPCSLGLLKTKPESGKFRLVKEVEISEESDGLQTLFAPFSLGESPFSLETPYGFPPLEELPEGYAAAEGTADGILTFTEQGLKNKSLVTDYIQKVSMNIPCQIRMV